MSELVMCLRKKTDPVWIDVVKENFDTFLLDHAACERKASATGINFICRYPNRPSIVDPMLRLAREELLHFHQVARLILKRGLLLTSDEKDPYVNALLKKLRNGREEHFLDRLLVFGIIEARGTERFGIVAENLKDEELSKFYSQLTDAESRHHELFTELALQFFKIEEVEERLNQLLDDEAKIVGEIPIRPAVH